MTFDFPDSPTTNQLVTTPNGSVFVWDGVKWTAGSAPPLASLNSPLFSGDPRAPTPSPGDNDTSVATTAFVTAALAAGASVTISDTAPATPKIGDMWWDSVGTQLYLRYNDGNSTQWVPATNQTALASVTISDTAPSSPKTGDMWFDSVGTQLYLRYNDGNSSQWVSATNLTTGVTEAPNDGQPYVRRNMAWTQETKTDIGRNLCHNSQFAIAQRGAGPWTTASYTVDRWQTNANDTFSFSQIALSNADRAAIGDESAAYALANTFTGSAVAGNYCAVHHQIEGVRRLGGKTIIVSLWARCGAGALRLGISMFQSVGTGGSPAGGGFTQASGATVTLSMTWARYSATFVLPSTAGVTLGTNNNDSTNLELCYSSGATYGVLFGNPNVQSGTIQLWGVQVEVAQFGQTQPSPLEKLDPVLALQQCQRFFYSGVPPLRGVTGATTAVSRMAAPHPVKMRAVPTTTLVTPLPIWDGGTATTLTSISTTNECTVDVLEFDGTCAVAWTAASRPAAVYQALGGRLDVSADF